MPQARPLGHNGSDTLEVVNANLADDAASGLAEDAGVLAHLMTCADGDADGQGDLGLVDVGRVELGVDDGGGGSGGLARANGGERPDLTHCDGWMEW